MSSTTRTPGRLLESPRWLERLLSVEISLDAELAAYLALVALAFVLHFWDLGSRALHHDESLHATYSYYLYKGSGYRHDPLMHGPVLFHLTALMYFLFGVSDATARFSAAFAGTALVFTPYFLRRWLGRWGALSASTMLVFSPAVLFYSRFIREDIFVALWTAGLLIGIWRYLRSGRTPWLYLAAACLALGFANKEITFMIAAVVLVYTDVLAALRLSRSLAERFGSGRRPSRFRRLATLVLLLPTAWVVAILWNPLRRSRRIAPLPKLSRAGDLLVVMGTLTLPQLSALVLIPLKHSGVDLSTAVASLSLQPLFDQTFVLTRETLVGGVTIIGLLIASTLAGLCWNPRRWLLAALVFYAIFVCLFTTFFTNPSGFASGIWGSLEYWLAQQDVQRGGQPVFYYLMMLPTYAYVSLVLALIGIVYQAARRGLGSILLLLCSIGLMPLIAVAYAAHNTYAIPLVIASTALAVSSLRGSPLRQMLLVWFGGMLFGLSIAGEKMPWLTLHLELPLTLMAGMTLHDLLTAATAGAVGQRGRLVLLTIALALGVIIAVPAAWGPGSDSTHAVVVGLAIAVAAVLGLATGVRWSPGFGLAVSTAMVLGLLAPLSLRTAFTMSYQHGDTPYEALIYTQSSPDIPKIMRDIEQYARESGRGYNQPIVVDAYDAFSWPWAWYLRDYHQTSYADLSGYVSGQASYRPPASAILLVNNTDRPLVQQFPGQFGAGVPYHHRWWFPEDYRGTAAASLFGSLRQRSTWSRWWGLIAAAHGIVRPEKAPAPGVHVIGTVDATAYFPPDYEPGVGIAPAAAERVQPLRTASNGALVLGGSGGAKGGFLRPADIAVDAQANLYVADSQNNRVEKFNTDGKLLATSGPDAALHEPWGIAVDRQGTVYVADTWNHRIVKLDAQLKLLGVWGYATRPTGPDSLLSLYGPRSIAFDVSGDLLVTDTGNNRIVKYSPDGQPLGSYGSLGSGPGQFQEPVGIAVGADGTVYIADTWNGRIDIFDPQMRFLRSLPVRGWESRDIEDKPYLALLPNGDILATQPKASHMLELSPAGAIVKTIDALGPDLLLKDPLGVATDANGMIYVSDGVNNQVIHEPASALP